jgi:non-ribosomal peptide synthetase component F
MIGAIKAGCGYVPIDTSVPSGRVNMIINKVQLTCKVTYVHKRLTAYDYLVIDALIY